MSDYKILAKTWWTPPYIDIVFDAATGISLSIGAVAIATGPNGDQWKAYIGYGIWGDEERDAQKIARTGQKLTIDQAHGIFPHLNIKEWTS